MGINRLANYRVRRGAARRACTAMLLAAAIGACSSGPRPIRIGEDHCAMCRMQVAEARFATALVHQEGNPARGLRTAPIGIDPPKETTGTESRKPFKGRKVRDHRLV